MLRIKSQDHSHFTNLNNVNRSAKISLIHTKYTFSYCTIYL